MSLSTPQLTPPVTGRPVTPSGGCPELHRKPRTSTPAWTDSFSLPTDPAPDALFDTLIAEGDVILDVLDQRAQDMPDKVYLHYGEDGIRLSYAEFKRRTDRLAAGLVALGLQPGQPVSVLTRNSLVSVLAMFAIWRAGGVFAPVNFNFKGDLLRYQLNDTQPFALITDPSFAHILADIATDLTLKQVVMHQSRPGDHDHNPEETIAPVQGLFAITPLSTLERCDDATPVIPRPPCHTVPRGDATQGLCQSPRPSHSPRGALCRQESIIGI